LEGIYGKSKSLLVPRLIGYSYAKKESPDAAKAIEWLDKYFAATKDNPSNIIASDYENYGKALQLKGDIDGAIANYVKAIDKASEKGEPNADLYMTIADIYKEKKDDSMRVMYLTKFLNSSSKYQLKESFALGQTYFLMGDYMHSDSIFEVMCTKMPTLHIGWSWRARSNAAMDPESKEGKAMPYYQEVINLLGSDPEKAAKYSNDYVQALRYFGSYHTLVDEKFTEAIGFWQKILDILPEDEGAKNGIDFCKQKGG
jgi:tetratricopeptide (TPR) repeat protein